MQPSSIEAILAQYSDYSGVVQLRQQSDIIWSENYGYRNISEQLPNTSETKFGIASGTKLLTGVAICQLIEQGKLTFDTLLQDILDYDFPNFDPSVTVYHLLTHTSGIPDYFDEETMDDFGALWADLPTYKVHSPADLLPLFQNEPMKFPPETRFHYNNAGFILLGLIIEAVSVQPYRDYVTEHVLKRAGMNDSSFYAMDRLPPNTALGYIHGVDGTPQTNIFQIPYIGSSDGGVFVTAPDFGRFWDSLLSHQLLGENMTNQLLTVRAKENDNPDDDSHYGLGIWLKAKENQPYVYYGVGADPGVSFASAYIPATETDITLISNSDDEIFWTIFGETLSALT